MEVGNASAVPANNPVVDRGPAWQFGAIGRDRTLDTSLPSTT